MLLVKANLVALLWGMTETDPSPKRARPGGRSARVRAAVLDAAMGELADKGWERFSIAGVAARAGVHQASIYRRWASRDALALDACLHFSAASLPLPDTGSLRGDLEALLRALAAMLQTPAGAALLTLAQSADPAVAAARGRFWAERFAAAGAIFSRAAARGEVPPVADPQLLLELLIAPLYLRLLVTGEPLDGLPFGDLAGMVARLAAVP